MNRRDQEHLLQDILKNDDLADLRQKSLQQGLASLASRRREKLAIKGVMLLLVVVVFTSLQVRLQHGTSKAPANLALVTPPAPKPKSTVKYINDEELFALFPDRPLALIGKPGSQQLVFLDQIPTPEMP